ncbi:MAG: hypothetical protein HY283_07595 [Nitrospirae bacterium]|nr:hypothetical protein [Nitrospirota bacterium]
MKRYRIVIGVVILCGLIDFSVTAASAGPKQANPAAVPIDRTVGSVQLGMTVEAFQKAVKSNDQTGMNPGLIADERSFEIARDSLVSEIRAVGCRFLHGRLYRITVEYREGAFDETRWDALVKKNMERYGKVPIQSQTLGERPIEFIQWDDPTTRLLLQREHRMGFESKQFVKRYGVTMVLLDQVLWSERQEAEGSLF